jgi:S1-C subfamily serine protease
MRRSAVTSLLIIFTFAGAAQAQQSPSAPPASSPWAVSVVHTIEYQKAIAQMKQRDGMSRLGVPDSRPQFIYNLATGLVVDTNGHVVTRLANLDLQDNQQKVSVTTSDGINHPARLIGVDCATGFAVLEVASLNTEPLSVADATSIASGMLVKILSTNVIAKAVQTPTGNRVFLTPSMTLARGNIGTTSIYGKARGALTLFSDGLLSRNDSSVVTNLQNQVVGIAQYAGFGRAYLYPINIIRDIIARRVIEKNGNVHAGWLGATGSSLAELPEPEFTPLGVANKSGVLVRQVAKDSPAAAGGLQPNDIIVGIDSIDIAGAADLTALLQSSPEGRKVKLRALRNHQPTELDVVLGARADDDWSISPVIETWAPVASSREQIIARFEELKAQYLKYDQLPQSKEKQETLRELEYEIRQIHDTMRASGIEIPLPSTPRKPDARTSVTPASVLGDPPDYDYSIGFTASDLSPQLAAYFKVKGGVLVRRVTPGSLAERAGLHAGDAIIGVQDKELPTAAQLQVLFSTNHENLTLKIVREQKPLIIKM